MQSVRDMKFREDLYFRISTFHLQIPPLRERPEDIPIIANSLLHNLANDLAREQLELSREQKLCEEIFLAGQYSRTAQRAGTRSAYLRYPSD